MRVELIACLEDNYSYLLVCPETAEAAVVDPSEAEPVLARAGALGVRITTLLATHHHWDHTGGIAALLARLGPLQVAGHRSDRGRIEGQNVWLDEGEPVRFGRQTGAALHVPGHTLGAVAYVFGEHVFTGDTLFLGGCGRLFEGDPPMMHASLGKLAALPAATRVFCGHEYTETNLRFAAGLLPADAAIARRLEAVQARVARGEPSVPGTMADELRTNVFLRCADPVVAQAVGLPGRAAAEVLAELRRLKSEFQG